MIAKIKQFILRFLMQKLAAKHQVQWLPKQVKHIAIWQFGGVGDMLLATPVLMALHQKYPQAALHIWCAYPQFSEFLKRFPQVQSVREFPVYDFDLRTMCQSDSRHHLLEYISSMQQEKIDMLINLHHPRQLDWWAVEWYVLAQIKPQYSLGFSPDYMKYSVLDAGLPSAVVKGQHYTLSYQNLLAEAGISSDTHTFFPIKQGEKNHAAQLLENVSQHTWVCLHMGGRRLKMENKMWSIASFIALAQKLVDDGRIPVLIGVESEQEMGNMLCQNVPQALNIIGQTTMGEMAAVIAQTQLFIGHDSGPFHIAVAVNTPAIAICGRPDAEPEYIAYHQDDVVVLTGDNPEQIRIDDVYQVSKRLQPCA